MLVLDEVWRYTRVRVRIERNLVNVIGGDIPDINPAFQMIGAFSAWSSHGREITAVNFNDRRGDHLPSVVSLFTPPQTVSTFVSQQGGVFDFGDL